jgi:hypothetical protein
VRRSVGTGRTTARHVLPLLCAAALVLGTGCTVPDRGSPAPASAPSAAPPATLTRPMQFPAPRPSADPAPTGPATAEPVIAGWNTVRSTQRAALYDVPPGWTVNSEDTITGFETKGGQVIVAGSGSASVGKNACGQYTSLATSVVKHSTSDDLPTASTLEAQQWAGAAFLDSEDHRPTLRTGKPETITTLSGKTAVIVKVTATAASSIGPCGPQGAAYAVSATGFTGRLGPTAILIVVAGSGFASAVPDDEIRQILTTLRPET